MHETRETELKYRVKNGSKLDRLRAENVDLAGYALGPIHHRRTVDLYWDTADYALTRSGFSLRTRRQNDEWLVTLKELSLSGCPGPAKRIEVEQALADEEVDGFLKSSRSSRILAALSENGALPSSASRVVFHKRDPKLHLLAAVQQRRDKRMLQDDSRFGGSNLAELSLDSVDVVTPASRSKLSKTSPLGNGVAVGHFHEVEVEVLPGASEVVLKQIADGWKDKRSFEPSAQGKAETALRLIAEHGQDGMGSIQRTTTMAEAGRAIWRRQMVEVLLNEAAIRKGTGDVVEAVHEMRVAIRRIRAAQRIFGPFFERKAVWPYLQTLRRLAKSLGVARDFDVNLALIDEYQTALTSQGEVLALLRQAWKAERVVAYQELQEWLTRREYSTFVRDFMRFCNTPGVGVCTNLNGSASPSTQQVRYVMPNQILALYTGMRVYETILAADTPPATFHMLRIEGKKLRYALEFVSPLLDKKASTTVIGKLKTLQDCLGRMNDATVMKGRVREFATQNSPSPTVTPVLDYLDEQMARERVLFDEVWTDFVSEDTRRKLAMSIAAI